MNDYELLKKRINIVDEISEVVQLKRNGKVLKGICPFHSDKTPSFTVYPTTNSYNCFGCNASGTVIDFVMARENLTPGDALIKLAEKYSITITGVNQEMVKRKKEIVKKERAKVSEFYRSVGEIENYVLGRGITKEVAKKFGLGYDKVNHSLTIPVMNTYSEVVGMAERFLEDGHEPKYKNSVESEVYQKSKLLYGLDKARKDIKEKVYIVEGYFDVMAMHVFGLNETVAYCGQSITDEQSKLLSNYITASTKIYLIPDKDETGTKNIRKNIQTLRLHNKNRISIIDIHKGKDINDYLLTGQDFKSLKVDPYEFYLLKTDLDNCLEIDDEYTVAYEHAKTTQQPMLRAEMAKYLATRWVKPLEVVKNHMNSPDNVTDYTTKMYTATDAYNAAQIRYRDTTPFLKTGLAKVDKMLQEIKQKEVMFIIGKSGSGKTTFILNLIYNMVQAKYNVLFNSLELAKESVIPQLIQIHKGLASKKVGDLIRSDVADVDTMKLITDLDDHLRIMDDDGQSMKDLENYILTANESVFDESVKVVFVDYFQYIKKSGKKDNYVETSDMAREMKALAKRTNTLLIVLTQAHRDGSGSGDKPLTMSAARDSGAIEESGDYVLGLYRPGANPELKEVERQEVQNEMYCQILKNRWGPSGEVQLYFNGMTKQIKDEG